MAVATSAPEAVTKNLYEGMFLLDSGKFASNPEEVTQHVLDFLEKAGAEVVAHRPWLDGRLAYEIEGKRRGVHYLIYFKMPGAGVTEITRRCKLSELVMRHLVASLRRKAKRRKRLKRKPLHLPRAKPLHLRRVKPLHLLRATQLKPKATQNNKGRTTNRCVKPSESMRVEGAVRWPVSTK